LILLANTKIRGDEMNKRQGIFLLIVGLFLTQGLPADARMGDDFDGDFFPGHRVRLIELKARLSGFDQVPSFSTGGKGRFRAVINAERRALNYSLSYEDMEGDVFMAHIHIGERHTNSDIIVWFCGAEGTPFPPPAGVIVPPCGAGEGVFEGTFTASDVLGPANRGIAPGEFESFLQALEAGATYVNVHSLLEPPGEIRGQIHGHGDPR